MRWKTLHAFSRYAPTNLKHYVDTDAISDAFHLPLDSFRTLLNGFGRSLSLAAFNVPFSNTKCFLMWLPAHSGDAHGRAIRGTSLEHL